MKDINHYDLIIIGAGASGLFTSIQAPKNISKLILEKNESAGKKILLSWGGRANFSNMDIDPLQDYFGQNKKILHSIFKKYNQYDLISFLSENNIEYQEENNGRLVLSKDNSRKGHGCLAWVLLDFLLQKTKNNNTEIKYNSAVQKIIPPSVKTFWQNVPTGKNLFEITTQDGEQYYSKKLVIAVGGKSFSITGTTGDGYSFAQQLGHSITPLSQWLCGIVTKQDLSALSGISCQATINIFIDDNKKPVYEETGPLLFTHWGLSGPIVFNTTVALGEHFGKNMSSEIFSCRDKACLVSTKKQSITIHLDFNLHGLPKRIKQFFNLNEENTTTRLDLQNLRSWNEAKVTSGGINTKELTNNLESKIVPGLYFTGEILDLTGKTGGFNLQLCWSTGNVVGNSIL